MTGSDVEAPAPRAAPRVGRRAMLALVVALPTAQIVDLAWPRSDPRAASPAGVAAAVLLFVLLAYFPSGTAVPRWIPLLSVLASVLFVAAAVVGPAASARWLWPLPLAGVLVPLLIAGQGYRYLRRSDAAEREAARWPLLTTLVALTIVLPADLVSVALTGAPVGDPPPVVAAAGLLFMLLPSLGLVAGLVAPGNGTVDLLLSWWIAMVVVAVAAGGAFWVVYALLGATRFGVAVPWPAVVAAAAAVIAALLVLAPARRLSVRAVFRGRSDEPRAVSHLGARLAGTLEPADTPAQFVEAVRTATGSVAVVLRRTGLASPWAQAGDAPERKGRVTPVAYLGLDVATLEVWPRPAESALSSADAALIDALATAGAPALHAARVAGAFPELTDRERQVLAGIARGLPNAAIAVRLGVSGKTVANYVSIVLTKLRVPDRERAAELARRRAAELG